MLPAGRSTSVWDGSNADGSAVGPGLYFARFSAPGVEQVRKAILVR